MASRYVHYAVGNAALGAAYLGAGEVGLMMAFEHGNVSPVWPPSGIALAGLLLLGAHFWPGVLLGALLLNLTTPVAAPTALCIAVGSTLQAVLGAWLLRDVLRIDISLDRLRDVLGLLVCGAMISTLTGATIGVLSLCLESGLHWQFFGRLWRQWWLGDAMGNLIVAPALLSWFAGPPVGRSLRRVGESAALTAGLVTACMAAYRPSDDGSMVARPFWLFPVLIWAALRFEVRGVTLVMAGASVIAIASTLQGYGPSGSTTPSSGLALAQAFLGVTAVTGLILGAVTAERRRMAEALRESETRHRAVVTQSADGIFLVDVVTKDILDANPALLDLLGYTRDELLRLTLYDFVAHDRESIERNTRRIVEDKAQFLGERRYRRKDGTLVDMEVRASLIRLGDREVMCVIAREITERKRAEEALRHVEEKARQSQKMEAIGRLAGGVAHDFNNLLTVILGYANILLAGASNGTRDALEEVRAAGTRAADLTKQLLAFSRKQILQPKTVNLNVVVADMGKMLTRLIGEDIDLVVATEPALGAVRVDPGQIEQVIVNLTVNARDAMARGGKLTISTANVHLDEAGTGSAVGLPAGDYVLLTVSDTGSGIDDETLPRIFEPFFTTKEVGKGTGLGLATVYGIVEQSGGMVDVSSRVGRGTTFRVYLPRVEDDASEGRREDLDELPRGSETVLVAEDDAAVRGLVVSVMRGAGYTVLEASNGQQALDTCERYEGEIHLVVTDLVMPALDGRRLAERVASARPGVKVLFISGYAEETLDGFDIEGETVAFLSKPFAPVVLARRVYELLSDR
jgi:two-component system, cell cycle sensor histidine kinase and response regulator CckA